VKFIPYLMAMLFLVMNARAAGFTTLGSLSVSNGVGTFGPMIISGNILYGTFYSGASNNDGTVFKVNTDGTGFTNLYIFGGDDGENPHAALALAGDTLYGTTEFGGSAGNGTVFKIKTDGTCFSNLWNFKQSGGVEPVAELAIAGSTLYGTTTGGGSGNCGTLFKINTDGTGFTNFYDFHGRDGDIPAAGLMVSDGVIYGTTEYGGNQSAEGGTIFKVNADGTGFTNLYNFTTIFHGTSSLTNGDGAEPVTSLMQSGNTLYGITGAGGAAGDGTLFRINTDGTGFTNVYNFDGGAGFGMPTGNLALCGHTFYGTAGGGTGADGTIFMIQTDETGPTNLYNFSGAEYDDSILTYTNGDGAGPVGGLTFSHNVLYGMTGSGGGNGWGTMFAYTLPPPDLGIQLVGNTVILNWNDPAFVLQAASGVTGSFTNVPFAVSPYTNAITGSKVFFRLAL
jgi:uncharacterized repeat protein (TIGR03803 family)